MQIINGRTELSRHRYGNKAANINILLMNGLYSLPGVAIDPTECIDANYLHVVLKEIENKNNNGYIVRSSGLSEDGVESSLAGHYLSVPFCKNEIEIAAAIQRVRASGTNVSCFIQPMIEPILSGVSMTINPLNYVRQNTTEYVEGHLEKIVNGTSSSHMIQQQDVSSLNERSLSKRLDTIIKRLEEIWTDPLEIEWAIDNNDNLIILQVRPVVLPKSGVYSITDSKLPSIATKHPKIKFRRKMHAIEASVSDAYVLLITSIESLSQTMLPQIEGAGISVVLLHPSKVNGKIARCFVPVEGSDVSFYVGECRRYAIRRYPDKAQLLDALQSISKEALLENRLVAIIVQAILPARWTGICTVMDDHLVMEIAVGHFVPKGIVPTSRYVITRNGSLIDVEYNHQDTAYHFIDGHVVEEQLPCDSFLSNQDAIYVAEQLFCLGSHLDKGSIEFGILDDDENTLKVYVIDELESEDASEVGVDDIARGIISIGRGGGNTFIVTNDDTTRSFDAHALDTVTANSLDFSAPITILADNATTSLLEVIRKLPRGSAVIFNKCSILSHVAVVLREMGIPAVKVNTSKFEQLCLADRIEIDSSRQESIEVIN